MSGKPPEIITILDSILYVGKIEFSSLHVSELKTGFYHANGDKYPVDSPQGVVLVSLSVRYKTDWAIVVSGSQINLPNWYASDGRGYLPRAGVTPGVAQGDAIRNITGEVTIGEIQEVASSVRKGVYGSKAVITGQQTWLTGSRSDCDLVHFPKIDASLQVPTANENRPLNKALTPVVYLGV
jgi:hypothetical protein